MRTRQEKARAVASRYGDVPMRAAAPLRQRSAVLVPVVAAVVTFSVFASLGAARIGAVAVLLVVGWWAIRAEYSKVVALDGDERLRIYERPVLGGRVRSVPVPLDEIVLPELSGLGFRRLELLGSAYWVQPIYDSELREIAKLAATHSP